MKRKIICLFISMFIIFAMGTISHAAEKGTVYLESSQDVVERGDEVEITVNLKGVTTAACDFSLYFDEDKWEYISKIENANVDGNRILFVWYDINGGRSAKQGEIAKLKFNVGSILSSPSAIY